MPVYKRIVCLANSRKLNHRCIAGREYRDGRAGAWIRPVSAREHEEVSEYERQYENGSDPQLLDLMQVPLIAPKGHGFQQENWLLDPNESWVRLGQVGWDVLKVLSDSAGALWLNGYSTRHGLNDTIPLVLTQPINTSLKLVHVDSLTLSVFKPGEAFGNTKRRVQA